ncbi:chaperone protein dnaJ GFA2, mitochondrial-like isoform X2 [Rutidosis leptorrhynchoides]|uniref:chaperone protein dnaJ GFA2, mitochondrial-like isoform X2 n=1 Tax=Rutidosis leptorrhynchoides TaxID=125765 RepID=UPI003A99015A
MVGYNGIKLLSWISRRTFSNDSTLYESLVKGGYRKFVVNSRYRANCLKVNACFGNTRSIHGTSYMAAKDYYDTLKVNKNVSASEIKKAYYMLAKKWHPDVNKKDPEAAETMFKEISKAYEVLKDEKKRAEYDQNYGFGGQLGCDSGGKDVKVSVDISFMEAVQGCTRKVVFQTELTCQSCDGTGIFVFGRTCNTCNGQKVGRGSKSVKVNIMPGVDTNEELKISRSGGADPDGKQPGDLYVVIKVRDHSVFRRQGPDIHVDAVVSKTQLRFGGTIQVSTLTGDVLLKVPPRTLPGQKVVMKGKGIKNRSSNSYGDQYVHFIIPTLNELNELIKKSEKRLNEVNKELEDLECAGDLVNGRSMSSKSKVQKRICSRSGKLKRLNELNELIKDLQCTIDQSKVPSGKILRCGKCGDYGHNQRTCRREDKGTKKKKKKK